MLDKMLSKWGLRLAVVVMVVLTAYVLWVTFTQTGPAAWLTDLQDDLLGRHSLKLTGALLLVPAVLLGYGTGFAWDYLTRQGMFRPRRAVRIVAVSPGPAPEEVRRAWVGLVLPLARGETGPRPVKTAAGEEKRGYVVDARGALQVLAATAPDAAAWWDQNAPACRQPGQVLLFPPAACEEVEGPA